MTDLDPIYVNIPCPTKAEGLRLCGEMLKQNLCGTAKVQENVHLLWMEDNLQEADIVLLSLKTTKQYLPKINEFILKIIVGSRLVSKWSPSTAICAK